jgi:RHS repeat-associated protein
VVFQWPLAQSAWDRNRGKVAFPAWHGTLFESKRDGSGLEYARNRVYDPAAGRFTQEDPIGIAGGLNLYGFAHGDPVNFADPFGLCPPANNNISDCPADQKFIHLTSGALRARASQTVDDYITLATTIGTGGEGAALAAAGGAGKVVIGETMERVISYAQKIGADWYKARGKNAANWLRNNLQWLRRQMKAGKEVVDIGEDALRAERSSAYAAEKALLERTGYPTASVPPP